MLFGIARSSFYCQPQPPSATQLDLPNRLDRIFTEHPVYGSWRVALLQSSILCSGCGLLAFRFGLTATSPGSRNSRRMRRRSAEILFGNITWRQPITDHHFVIELYRSVTILTDDPNESHDPAHRAEFEHYQKAREHDAMRLVGALVAVIRVMLEVTLKLVEAGEPHPPTGQPVRRIVTFASPKSRR